MARSIEPLVVGRVVGDVIDMFVPSVDLAVQYTSRQVNNRSPPSSSSHTWEREVQDERRLLLWPLLFPSISSTGSLLHNIKT
jgi:hypothetical protein